MRNRKFLIACGFLALLFPFTVSAQISQGGQPGSFKINGLSSLGTIAVLPGSKAIPSALKEEKVDKHGAYEFAYVFEVDYSPENSGQWDETKNGEKIWRLGLESEGAYSLNIIFDQFVIPPGAELFIYNSDQSVILGAFTSENNNDANVLAIAPVSGSFIIVEYNEPKNTSFNGLLHIGKVGHDYTNAFGKKDGDFGLSGTCNVDINCDEGNNWQVIKRSVCKLLINGHTLCTGSLVNNSHRNQKPYILTANHCIDYQSDATNTVFIFNYESANCADSIDGSVSQSVSGATLLATKNPGTGYLDFSLLMLNDKVPLSYNPYFAGWDARGVTPTKTTCIHHPKGDVKKITFDYDAPEIGSTYGGYGYDPYTFIHILKWDLGTTEKGSSGAPLFDENQRLIGTLTGGDANCELSVNDYYQMFSVDYNRYNDDTMQLKHWLDPDNEGLEYLDGFKPLPANSVARNILSFPHWDVQKDSGAVYFVDEGFGYVSGNNSYGDKAKAEFFTQSEFGNCDVITGAYVWFAQAKGRPYQDIELFLLPEIQGEPASFNRKLGSSYLWMNEIKKGYDDSTYVYFPFYPPIEITSNVYAGIMLPQNEGDTIAVVNSYYDPSVNTAWEMDFDNKWWAYLSTWGNGSKKFALLIALEAGIFTSVNDNRAISTISLFPNPVKDKYTLKTKDANRYLRQLNVHNNLGQLVYTKQFDRENQTTVDVSNWINGIYICKVQSDNGTETLKLIVQH